MRRRQYLAALATSLGAATAGCNTTTSSDTIPTTQQPPATTQRATSTTPALLDLELDPSGLNENNVEDVPNTHAEAVVRNPGEHPQTNVQVRARWYNSDGYLIGDDYTSVPILPAGERWYLWLYPVSVAPDAVADVELSVTGGGVWPGSTPGIELSDTAMREVDTRSEDPQAAYLVEGLAENTTDVMVDVSVVALLRMDDGTVVYADSVSQGLVPAGDTWAWDMGWQVLARWSLVEDYTLYVRAV